MSAQDTHSNTSTVNNDISTDAETLPSPPPQEAFSPVPMEDSCDNSSNKVTPTTTTATAIIITTTTAATAAVTEASPRTPLHDLRPRRPKGHPYQCVCCMCATTPEKPTTPRKRKNATPRSSKKGTPTPKKCKVAQDTELSQDGGFRGKICYGADDDNDDDDDEDKEDRDEGKEEVKRKALELSRKTEELQAATTEITREKIRAELALAEANELRGELGKQDAVIKSLAHKLTCAQSDAAAQEGKQRTLEEENSKILKELETLKELMAKKDHELEALDTRRRKAVDDLEEVSCRIRVLCRVKPDKMGSQLSFPYPSSVVWTGNPAVHTYDAVLQPQASQADVLAAVVPYVEPVVDGHSCCVMAYGQTGSGKTHTLVGDIDSKSEQGLIPRALEALLALIERRKLLGWDYKLMASVLEVYNEVIYDLLNFEKRPIIRHDAENKPILFDATVTNINNLDEVLKLLKQATQNRVVAATKFNMASSRSHVLFRFYVYGTKAGTTAGSCLNVVDLSGSERFDSTAECSRITETVSINKSLSTLMHVVTQLALHKPHVPYRDSTLTHLLQASLSGRSKVVLIATVSGAQKNKEETLSTLRFADVACSCALNLPPQMPRALSKPQTPVKSGPQSPRAPGIHSRITPKAEKPITKRSLNVKPKRK